MASLVRKTFTKPLPLKSERFERKGKFFARWTDTKGKQRSARICRGESGEERIIVEARTWTAKYRDGSGRILEVSTGCRDKSAAQARLSELVRDAEMVRGGVISAQEASTAHAMHGRLFDHFNDYKMHLVAKGVTKRHQDDQRRLLERVADECRWTRLSDVNRTDVERWLALQSAEAMSARTRNTYSGALVAFGNWAVRVGRLGINPLAGLPKANERADRRRERRALTLDELNGLFAAAVQRPLNESMHGNRGKNPARLKDETRAYLVKKGRERALIYRTLAFTGLRFGELRSLTVAQAVLNSHPACIVLYAADEKARRGAQLPLRDDLAEELRQHLAEKLAALKLAAERANQPIPLKLPSDATLFDLPLSLKKVFDADLRAAKISKRDDRGRVLDVHCLRHTFATMLAKANVPLQQAQQLMRHSDPRLTSSVYTHLTVLDSAAAVAKLPNVAPVNEITSQLQAINDCTSNPSALAPMLAPAVVVVCPNEAQSGQRTENAVASSRSARKCGKSNIGAGFRDVAARDTRREMVNGAGFEPAATGLKVRCSTN